MRTCTKCGVPKPDSEFSKDRARRDGLHPWCNECKRVGQRSNYTRNRKSILAKHKLRVRGYTNSARLRTWSKYGIKISVKEYDHILLEQNGKCKICNKEDDRRLSVDHTTGTVRGLLCRRCNSAIGLFGDSPQLLVEAAKYLESKAPGMAGDTSRKGGDAVASVDRAHCSPPI